MPEDYNVTEFEPHFTRSVLSNIMMIDDNHTLNFRTWSSQQIQEA